jgi:hypothetical protein
VILKKLALHKCCSNDTSRPALLDPYFDGKMVFATDGRKLVATVPQCIDTDDVPGPIPKRVFKEKVNKLSGCYEFKLTAEHAIINGIHFPRYSDEHSMINPVPYPNCINVIWRSQSTPNTCVMSPKPSARTA